MGAYSTSARRAKGQHSDCGSAAQRRSAEDPDLGLRRWPGLGVGVDSPPGKPERLTGHNPRGQAAVGEGRLLIASTTIDDVDLLQMTR